MKTRLSAFALPMLLAAMPLAHAQIQYQPIAPAAAPAATLSPSAQFSADSKAASARLASDQQLCNGEADSASRMQCKRDAKAEYDKAVADAKARMAAASAQPRATAQPVKAVTCADCGTVVSVTQGEKPGEGSAVGLIAGGVAGALLGNQIGGGNGKKLATLAGAAGGAFAGREVEKRVSTQTTWSVAVQYPGSQNVSYEFTQDPGFRAGDVVRRSEGSIVRR
jgi:outer membrane lipoprotein SlyB